MTTTATCSSGHSAALQHFHPTFYQPTQTPIQPTYMASTEGLKSIPSISMLTSLPQFPCLLPIRSHANVQQSWATSGRDGSSPICTRPCYEMLDKGGDMCQRQNAADPQEGGCRRPAATAAVICRVRLQLLCTTSYLAKPFLCLCLPHLFMSFHSSMLQGV